MKIIFKKIDIFLLSEIDNSKDTITKKWMKKLKNAHIFSKIQVLVHSSDHYDISFILLIKIF